MKSKKRLTQQQEFDIMKMVLDKFLWVGTAIMLFGLYQFYTFGLEALKQGLILIAIGAIVLIMFLVLIVREFEIIE